jgi:hypothetical protein
MAQKMTTNCNGDSPAMRAMEQAIELNIQGRSPYPDRAYFLDDDVPDLGKWIARATDEHQAIVLVSQDGSTRVLHTEYVTHVASAD